MLHRTIITTTRTPGQIIAQGFQFIVSLLELLLLCRFVLKLLDKPGKFTTIIDTLSYPFIRPFQGFIPDSSIQGALFEWTTLIAILVYWLVTGVIVYFLSLPRSPHTEEIIEEHIEPRQPPLQ